MMWKAPVCKIAVYLGLIMAMTCVINLYLIELIMVAKINGFNFKVFVFIAILIGELYGIYIGLNEILLVIDEYLYEQKKNAVKTT